jgi:hypothetical protein
MPSIKMLSDDNDARARIDNYRANCIGWEGAGNDPDHLTKVRYSKVAKSPKSNSGCLTKSVQGSIWPGG